MKYKVIFDNQDVAEFLELATWEGHIEKPNRTLTLNFKNTINGRTKAFTLKHGKTVQFYVDGKKIFVGVVVSTNIDESGGMSATCYDKNWYLLKSNVTRQYKNKKASAIIKQLAKDFGIPVGTIEDTGYVIPKLILRNQSLYDHMLKALVLTRKQNGKRFLFGNENGKLTLKQHKNNVAPWILAAGSNLISASYSVSIEELKNQVKVVGGKDDKYSHTAKSISSQKLYGVMQHYEEMDEKATKSQVKQQAEKLLKEKNVLDDQVQVTALGILDVISGKAIYVKEPMTGLLGGYYVSSDVHTFTAGEHNMQLIISKSLELPTIEISDEELGKKVK